MSTFFGRSVQTLPGSRRASPGNRRLIAWAAACWVTALGQSGAVQAAPAMSAEGAWAPGRVIVGARAGLSELELQKILQAQGGRGRLLGGNGLYLVEFRGPVSERAVAARLAGNPHLKFAEVDRALGSQAASNDPMAGSQWHLPKIGAPAAWDTTQGAGVTIAILDSGVEGTHPDLSSRLVPGWNFVDNNSNTADVRGHGTWVAGTAAATLNNGTGVASVAGQARIMPVRISDSTGTTYISTIVQGVNYAADRGARVVNLSFAAAGSSAIESAAQYLKSKGGLLFVSAGNSGADFGVPASAALVVVAATDDLDRRASWSNHGPMVQLSAPGTAIYTTGTGAGYVSVQGTSFSSPLAAGVAALVMSANPALDATQVQKLMFSNAVDLGAAGWDPYFGHGRIDAAAAVRAALAAPVSPPPADTQAPAVAISAPLGSATVTGLVPVNVTASDNVGVTRVELRVDGALVATDAAAPFGFSWNSTLVANGSASLVATAFDAAGNSRASAPVGVNVANAAVVDTTPPAVTITSPTAGRVAGNVSVDVKASDNSGPSGITQRLFIDGVQVAQSTGAALSYKWNTHRVTPGNHVLKAVAVDAAGNSASMSVGVVR